MNIMSSRQGRLKIDVASNGNMIRAGADVIVEEVCDNFGNKSVTVSSVTTTVRLNFYDTDVDRLVDQ